VEKTQGILGVKIGVEEQLRSQLGVVTLANSAFSSSKILLEISKMVLSDLSKFGPRDSFCVSLVYHMQGRDILTPYILLKQHSFIFEFFIFILL
jgi:hypothetical protein